MGSWIGSDEFHEVVNLDQVSQAGLSSTFLLERRFCTEVRQHKLVTFGITMTIINNTNLRRESKEMTEPEFLYRRGTWKMVEKVGTVL